MGSEVYLRVGGVVLDWGKNRGFVDHRVLFGNREPVVRPILLDNGEREEEVFSQSMLGSLLPRLEVMGYSLDFARTHIVDDFFGWELRADYASRIAGFTIPAERTTEEFSMLALEEPGVFFDTYAVLRLLAENPVNRDAPVTWEIHDIIQGGWATLEEVTGPPPPEKRFLLITEGSTDSHILSRALRARRPEIADFFDFIDMKENYPFSGVGNLVNFLKGLVKIGVARPTLAIFDNDGAGLDGLRRARDLDLPDNLGAMKLPDLPGFAAMSTDGPTGKAVADINGKAASIECYLDFGTLLPVIQWTNYVEGAPGYWQGAIGREKRLLQADFERRSHDASYDYTKLDRVLDEIVKACAEMARRMRVIITDW